MLYALTADVPFGPFENTPLQVFVGGRSKAARIHADLSCKPSAVPATMPLNAQTVDRMCKQCARWGRWARRDSAVAIFLHAVRWMPQEILDTDELAEEFPANQQAEAVRLLATGEYPDDDDDNEDSWADYDQARQHRDDVVDSWMSAIDMMHRLCRTVENYPWLSPWAERYVSAQQDAAELLRQWMTELVSERSLIVAAAARSLTEPGHPSDRPELASIGSPDQVERLFGQAWRRWREDTTSNWVGVTTSGGYHARGLLTSPIERKRKSRAAAMAVLDEVFAGWAARARAAADAASTERVRTLAVSMVDAWPSESDHHKRPQLSPWENGVLAHYAVAFEWARAAVLLKVPEPVATCLLATSGALRATELTGNGDPVAAFREWARDNLPIIPRGPLPGVIDDSPVSARQPLMPGNLDALIEVGGWLYQVWSVERGMEVLHVDVLRSRQEAGWTGMIVAGPEDLPASLIDPWVDEVLRGVDREAEFDELGLRRGELAVVSLVRGNDRDDVESGLRALALARGAVDLRTVGGARWSGFNDHHVWFGLLDLAPLDLTPFELPSDDRLRPAGLALPLSVLATAQIYSTSIGTAGYKGHSPSCAHARSGRLGLDEHYEMTTVKDLVNRSDLEWCSKCGGYAIRRLDDAQVRYYRNSHRLLAISRALDRRGGDLSVERRDEILAELKELADARPGLRAWDEEARTWLDVVNALRWSVGRLSVPPA